MNDSKNTGKNLLPHICTMTDPLIIDPAPIAISPILTLAYMAYKGIKSSIDNKKEKK